MHYMSVLLLYVILKINQDVVGQKTLNTICGEGKKFFLYFFALFFACFNISKNPVPPSPAIAPAHKRSVKSKSVNG